MAAVVAVGCGGGDDSNDFRKDYNAIVRQYSLATDRRSGTPSAGPRRSPTGSSRPSSGTSPTGSRRRGREARGSSSPPGRRQGEYDGFVDGLSEVQRDLSAIAKAAKEHSSKETTKAATALVEDSKAVAETETALKKAVD